MDETRRIERVIAPVVADLGFELVRVQTSGARRPVLQVMVERVDGTTMTVEDCAVVSREISAVLDVADPIAGPYTLEVSSPGIDRPLTRLKDFHRFRGFEAKIETRLMIDGRRRFKGVLSGVDDGVVGIEADGVLARIPFDAIQRAKLVLTDALLAASAPAEGTVAAETG